MQQLTEIKEKHSHLFSRSDSYVRFLNLHKDKRIYCCPYPGNPGDKLIYKGTAQLLADLQTVVVDNPNKADFLLYPGGCPTMWPGVMEKIVETMKIFPDKKIVIGPATFEFGFTDWPKIFIRYSERIAGLFCRDKKSYENLKKAKLSQTIVQGLSHDPSLYLKDSPFIQELKAKATEEYVLAALRRDHEMKPGMEEEFISKISPLLNEKISRKLLRWARKREKRRKIRIISAKIDNLPIKDVDIWLLEDCEYLKTICRAKQVHTDRLHVMIVSAMLGKKVFAYPTLYNKLENVYEHSLKNWADITFVNL